MFRLFKKIRKLISTLFTLALLIIIIVVLPAIPDTLGSGLMVSMHTDSAPKLIAHRGLSSLYPQNTLPAFHGAAKYGFEAFELDIHTTKDGEWVVIHNDTVDDMTDGEGEVAELTLEEILKLNIDNGNGIEEEEIKSLALRIPTLRQALDVCKEWDITPVIEIKNCDTSYLPDLKVMLDEYGLSDTAAIISFTKEYLEIYRELDKDIEILYLSHDPTKEDIDWCAEQDFGINFNHKCLYKCFSAIKYAREKGITIAAWTVDNTIYADIMVLFGAEYITTNKILP